MKGKETIPVESSEGQKSNPFSQHNESTKRRLIRSVSEDVSGYVGKSLVLGGRILGQSAFPLKRYLDYIARETSIDIDEQSTKRLHSIAQKGKPIFLASNHRGVDSELYPFAHYRINMSVDSLIWRHLFASYDIPLRFLAQYNRYTEHPQLWRRGKARIGNKVREGLYEELGYLPVHISYRKERREEDLGGLSYATHPLSVAKQIQRAVGEGSSVGFFTYYTDTDDLFPERLRPGVVYYGAQLGVDVIPAVALNAKHMDPRRTASPDNVVLRIGEAKRIEPLSKKRTIRRQQMKEALDDLRGSMFELRRDAFAALKH